MGGEIDRLAGGGEGHLLQVEHPVPIAQGRLHRGGAGVAELDQNPGPQLLQLIGLGQVVVRTQAQQLHLVGQLGLGGQDDYRRLAGFADLRNELAAGQARERQVHQQQVNAARLPQQTALGAGKSLDALTALTAQIRGGGVVNIGIVFDDQNAGHGTASSQF